MTDRTLTQYTDILRADFAAFTHRAFLELYGSKTFKFNWHIELLAERLEAVRLGSCKRLIINLPPRHLKSFVGSVAFPAFVLGHTPAAEILCVSYGQTLTDDLARSCRQLMQSRFYQALFRTRLANDRQALDEFGTTAGGVRRARSMTGGITGIGADYIIIDDPIKPDEAQSGARRPAVNEAFYSTIYSRLNDKETGRIVLIMQRLHQDDLVAHIQEQERWDILALPAIADTGEVYDIRTPYGIHRVTRPEGEALHAARESIERLTEIRRLNPWVFSAQYQQNPQPPEGAIIKRDWLKFYNSNELPCEFDIKIQSWDTANKTGEANSYSVCTTWGISSRHFYLLHVFRERLEFPALRSRAMQLNREHSPTTVVVEPQQSGSPLLQVLTDSQVPVEAAALTGADKAARLHAQIDKFAGGYVHIPKQAHWLDTYVDELTSFPYSKFSDQVDSTVQALAWASMEQNTSFANAMGGLKALYGDPTEVKALIKVRVKKGNGQIRSVDGKKLINYTEGEIIELDQETAIAVSRNMDFELV